MISLLRDSHDCVGFLRSAAGARAGSYALKQMKDSTRNRPIAQYKLQQTKRGNGNE
jgi:hypothetical protein